ncbi:MAG TPA: LmeA family phospholipid-binding protein [Actinomycetota bacterium]|nr:LmeA family phospholipid-binding protein [Actinomycetota bacterium]
MRLLIRLFLLAAVLGVAAELVAPSLVESQMEARVRDRTRGAVGVTADVQSFPLLTRLALTGQVRHVEMTLDEVSRERLLFATVRYELDGVTLDRSALYRRRARVSDIDRGRIVATLEAEDLAAGLGIPLDLAPGDVSARVVDRVLRLGEGAGAEISESLPQDILPCDPEASLDAGRVILSCSFTGVPPVLKRAEAVL